MRYEMGIQVVNRKVPGYNINIVGQKLKSLIIHLKEYWLISSLFLNAGPISIDIRETIDFDSCVEIILSRNQSLYKHTLNLKILKLHISFATNKASFLLNV